MKPEIKAALMYKESAIEAKNCIIEKIIRISADEFDRFSGGLLRDWDFLRDNKPDTAIDSTGRYRCLLITGEGRRDGILVNTEGANYARYSAFIPNVEDFLNAQRYPALAELNKMLTAIVDVIAEQGGVGSSDGRGIINLQEWEDLYGIDFMTNGALRYTVLDMLSERQEIKDWKLDAGQLIVWREINDAYVNETLVDPSVTPANMHAYGYTWDGMILLSKERALELFDSGYGIYRLYEDDAEGAADCREAIEDFDGMFGIENPAWVEAKQTQPINIARLISEEKPSVLEEIKASRDSSHEPKAKEKDARKLKKNKGDAEL